MCQGYGNYADNFLTAQYNILLSHIHSQKCFSTELLKLSLYFMNKYPALQSDVTQTVHNFTWE